MLDADVLNKLIIKLGIRVDLVSDYPVICETLERIGIINHSKKEVYPSCYCVKHNDADGREVYTICHFKEMFVLQGKPSTFNETDKARMRTIVYLLQDWNLLKVVNNDDVQEILMEKISVLPFSKKKEYRISHKFKNNN